MSDSTHLGQDHRHRLRHGAHRSRGGLAGALMPSVLAVAAVAALITALAVWQGEELEHPRASAASETRDAAGPAEQRPAQKSTPKSTQEPTATSAPAASATTGPPESATSEPERSRDEVPDLEVVVLNQTTRSGLAGSVADRLRASGWEVPAVGNFRGIVPATTVYYPAGAEADALAVARDLPTEPRVRPRFGNLSTTRLTVVVTDSYPG